LHHTTQSVAPNNHPPCRKCRLVMILRFSVCDFRYDDGHYDDDDDGACYWDYAAHCSVVLPQWHFNSTNIFISIQHCVHSRFGVPPLEYHPQVIADCKIVRKEYATYSSTHSCGLQFHCQADGSTPWVPCQLLYLGGGVFSVFLPFRRGQSQSQSPFTCVDLFMLLLFV
jgi:hypothetical protein